MSSFIDDPHFGEVTPRYAELAGRVAVVTGAAKGIGQGIAVRLGSEAMRLVVADIDEAALRETATALEQRGAEVLTYHSDLALPGQIDGLFGATLERFGRLDLLVNNAADLRRHRLLDDHGPVLDRQLAVNVRVPYFCSQRAAETMKEAGGGNIVQISSVGALRAHHRGLPYDVTKGAINAMTMAMAVDLGEYGIRVNAIGPGVTYTHRTVGSDPEDLRATSDRIPLRRIGTVSDIGAMVAFLASDESTYITGQVMYVDGGITVQLSPQGPGALEGGDRNDVR